MELRQTYNANGAFEPELYYVQVFGIVPNRFDYDVSDSMERDVAEMKFDYLKDKFKDITLIRQFSQINFNKPSEVELDFEYPTFGHSERGSYFIAKLDNKIISVKYDGIIIYYQQDTIENVQNLAETIFNIFPPKKEKEKRAKINLIRVYQGDYYVQEKDIKPTIVNIDENYNDDFKQIYEDTVKFLNDRCSGLVLFYGAMGSGKTNLIRYLCSSVYKEWIVVPNSIAARLGDPDLTTFITDHTDSVFILEDCEQLLEDRGENPFNNAISTILNMADGLLSDVCNIKFICTFNAPINKIDPALLRKGRCVAKYEFGKLSKDKVAYLNEKYNLGHKEITEMTLAEVYNPDKVDYTEKETRRKIGF